MEESSKEKKVHPVIPKVSVHLHGCLERIDFLFFLFQIGDVVLLQRAIASVMYIGPVHWDTDMDALYVGLELPEPIPN